MGFLKHIFPLVLWLFVSVNVCALSYEDLTDTEIEEIASVVMAEASTEPIEGKIGVVATIINRSRIYGMAIHEVVNQPNQYASTYNGEISKECYQAIEFYFHYQDEIPDDVVYFQQYSYSKYGEDYAVIGNHYFSAIKHTDIEEDAAPLASGKDFECCSQSETMGFSAKSSQNQTKALNNAYLKNWALPVNGNLNTSMIGIYD